MKTYLDCVPCFFKQALEAARIAAAGRRKQKHNFVTAYSPSS
ncbi:MAG: hypothetical protein U9R44_04205 [Candidatus Omnitrophota bacterium]|nr:hypothetical protein [Candidatus Omnitrophota bacterium]